jgi:hypothetical protein
MFDGVEDLVPGGAERLGLSFHESQRAQRARTAGQRNGYARP